MIRFRITTSVANLNVIFVIAKSYYLSGLKNPHQKPMLSQQTATIFSQTNVVDDRLIATSAVNPGDLVLIDHCLAGNAYTVYYGVKYDYDLCLKLFPRIDITDDKAALEKMMYHGFRTPMCDFVVGSSLSFVGHRQNANCALIILSMSTETSEYSDDESDEDMSESESDEAMDEESDEDMNSDEDEEDEEGSDVMMDDQCFAILVALKPIAQGEEIIIGCKCIGEGYPLPEVTILEEAKEKIIEYCKSPEFEERSAHMDNACASGAELAYGGLYIGQLAVHTPSAVIDHITE